MCDARRQPRVEPRDLAVVDGRDGAVERLLGAAHVQEVRKGCEALLLTGRKGEDITCAEIGMDSARHVYLSSEWLELAVRLEMRRDVDVVAIGTGERTENQLGLRLPEAPWGGHPRRRWRTWWKSPTSTIGCASWRSRGSCQGGGGGGGGRGQEEPLRVR